MPSQGSAARRSFSSLVVGLALGCAAGCVESDPPVGGGRRGIEQCPVLTYEEFKEIRGAAFTDCLHTEIQSIRSGRDKHSQCVACRDKCMQDKDIWPLRYLGKPCG